MITEPVDVLLVGLTDGEAATILDDDGFTATSVRTLDEVHDTTNAGAVVLALEGDGPLDALRRARTLAPDAAIVVVSDDAHAADATVALHAGAEDQLPSRRDAADPAAAARSATPSGCAGSDKSSPRRTTPPSCRTSAGSPRSPSTTCGWPTG